MSKVLRPGFVAAAVLALSAGACHLTNVNLWQPGNDDAGCEVLRVKGATYCDGLPCDRYRHRLDLFLPRDRADFPVIVLIHGGAWAIGDNRCCGLYSSVGEYLAGRGIGVVLPNYRLSPRVKHPEHVKDVARAVAWTHQHIAEYGGNPEQLFLVGHSAGGHLAALLATDTQYLEAEKLDPHCIRGVVGVSGVYHIPPGKVEATLGGSFRVGEVLPVRGESDRPAERSGIPFSVNLYGLAFGDDTKVRADASPVNHVRPGLPPFLLVNASNDLPTLSDMSSEFHDALREHGCDARLLTIPSRNHNSIFFRAMQPSDPLAAALEGFVKGRVVSSTPGP